MPTPTLPFFHPDALFARFSHDINKALRNEALSEIEHDWLIQCRQPPAFIRTDQPALAAGLQVDPQLACALVFSHADGENPAVYLWTVLDGIEPFNKRDELHERLRALQGSPQAEFELTRTGATPFDDLANTYVLNRGNHLSEVATWFGELPNLDQQLQAAMAVRLATHFPGEIADPETAWLQVTNRDGSKVLRTMTLAERHLQIFARQALGPGELIRWLSHGDDAITHEERDDLQRTMDTSHDWLPDAYVKSLGVDWKNHRESIARLYGAGFYQALLQARHNHLIQDDHWPWLRTAIAQGKVQGVAVAEHGASTSLLNVNGVMLIGDPGDEAVYAYDGADGLQRHANRASYMYYLLSLPALPRAVTLDDQKAWHQLKKPQVLTPSLGTSPLLACVDAVQQCQLRNLRSGLPQQAGSGARAMVLVDEALDVRDLIDTRLKGLDAGSRWTAVPLRNQSGLIPRPETVATTARWMKQINGLGNRYQGLRGGVTDLRQSVVDLLAPALCVIDPKLVSTHVLFELPATEEQEARSINLEDVLIERLTLPAGHSLTLPAALGTDEAPLHTLPATLVRAILDQASSALPAQLKAVLASDAGWRLQGLWEWPQRESRQIREGLLRIELSMQRQYGQLQANALDQLQQVLDYPLESQRKKLPVPTEAFEVAVQFNDRAEAVLTNAFVLGPRGKAKGPLLLWTILEGLQSFDTDQALSEWLTASLHNPPENRDWMQLFMPADGLAFAAALKANAALPLKIVLAGITESLPARLQEIEWNRQQASSLAAWQQACDFDFEGDLAQDYVHTVTLDGALNSHLLGLAHAVEYCHLKTTLPAWLTTASMEDFITYTALVRTCEHLQREGNDYLFGIADLATFTHRRVSERLRKDLGANAPDPGNVLITLRHFEPAMVGAGDIPSHLPGLTQERRETLTEAAIDQLSTLPGTPLILEMTDASPLPEALNADYVHKLLRELDVGSQYRALLAEKFNEDNADYPERQRRFARQLTAELLTNAFQQQLMETLTDTAFHYIQTLLVMPDAQARTPWQGVDVVIRPLQFQAASFLAPDQATGLHLIGAKDMSKGPLILYTVYTEEHVFREYANKEDLLKQLRGDTELQTLVLSRLDPAISGRYARHGFVNPHLTGVSGSVLDIELRPVGTVIAEAQPAPGHALRYLFVDNLALLQRVTRDATVTTNEAWWKTFRYLMTLGLEQGSILLPGPMAKVVNLWQASTWFEASLGDAAQQRWGQALGKFVAALSLLGGSRQRAERMMSGSQQRHLPYSSRPPVSTAPGQLTAKVARVETYEILNFGLHQMNFDTRLRLYTLKNKYYAVVLGRVCEVRKIKNEWRLVQGERVGPVIRWNAVPIGWQLLDTIAPLSCGYNIKRILQHRGTKEELKKCFTTQAEGMDAFFALDPQNAQDFGLSYEQAQNYLLTTLENLNARKPWEPLSATAEQRLKDFFGTAATTPALLGKLRKKKRKILKHLTEPSMDPQHSQRYVFGQNMPGYENTHAFVYHGDHFRRIFFTERFLRVDTRYLANVDTTLSLVDPLRHAQAATLIHEVSHLVTGSVDIAYLHTCIPDPDIMLKSTPAQRQIADELTEVRNRLSTTIDPADLFEVEDRVTGQRRDIDLDEGRALDRILALTGAEDLGFARDVFTNDESRRADVILANADSIALLATQMGRERW